MPAGLGPRNMRSGCTAAAVAVAFLASASAAGAQQPVQGARAFPNGLPHDAAFFPIGVWLQSPHNAAAYQAIGVNTYIGLWNPPTSGDLALLERHGMHAIIKQTPEALALPNVRVVRGWLQPDEPDNAQPNGRGGYGDCIMPTEVLRRYAGIRSADPSRPVLLNFGQAVANPHWFGRGARCSRMTPQTYYRASIPGADIVSFDIYPAAEERQLHIMGRLELVGQGVANLRRWARPHQQVWSAIETTHINNPWRRPTPEEVRSEVWMALIHGASGIFYFVHEWKPSFREDGVFRYPEVVEEIARINAQITTLAPVLNSPTLLGRVHVAAPAGVATLLKQHAGDTYLFAANMEKRAIRATLELHDIGGRWATVIGQDRSLAMDGGRITDGFGPYAVRLYRIPGVR